MLVEKTKAQRPVVEEVEGAGDALDVGAKAKADADAEAHELAEKVALREKKLESIEYQNELIEDEAIEFEEDKKRQEALETAEDALVAQAHEQQEAELAEADELKDLATVTAAEVPREERVCWVSRVRVTKGAVVQGAVARAGLSDLESVNGISAKVARAVYDHFHGNPDNPA